MIVTHLYGRLADLDQLKQIADARGVALIEDCAQAHGAERRGRKAGSVGAIGSFSFYPTKNLGALGDAGALTTNDDRLADALKRLRQYGWSGKYNAVQPYGRNSRLDEMQAAMLRVKLPKLDAWNARRREIIARYRRAGSNACTFSMHPARITRRIFASSAAPSATLCAHFSRRATLARTFTIQFRITVRRRCGIFFPQI